MVAGIYSLSAQLENRFSIGPRVGVNFTNHTGNANSSVQKIVAGITSTYSINENSGVTVDALYSSRGYAISNITSTVNYLEIPIAYNTFFGSLGERFRPKIYAGIAPSILLNAERGNSEITSQFNSTTLSILGGLGFNYRLANRVWLNTDLRALLGVSDVEKNRDYQDRTIQLSVGIAYGI